MQRALLVLGISPQIILPAILVQGAVGLFVAFAPYSLMIPWADGGIPAEAVGLFCLSCGFMLLRKGWRDLEDGFFEGELVDPSAFAEVRRPVYGAWMLFVFPGIAFMCRAWPMFAASLVAWTLYRVYAARVETRLWYILLHAWKFHMFKVRWFPDESSGRQRLPI